jgi:Helix-turn-helix domain
MSRRKDKGKLPPFVPLFRLTMKTAAWRALSPGARATFVVLKSNYNSNAQNAVFLSGRTGAKELGVHRDTVSKWLRELEHYGFIILVRGAHLGVHGAGKAALYRLTDCHHAGQAPTYDFQSWDGVLFETKKQNPGLQNRPPRPTEPAIRAKAETAPKGEKRPTEPAIRTAWGRPKKPAITSFATRSAEAGTEEEADAGATLEATARNRLH